MKLGICPVVQRSNVGAEARRGAWGRVQGHAGRRAGGRGGGAEEGERGQVDAARECRCGNAGPGGVLKSHEARMCRIDRPNRTKAPPHINHRIAAPTRGVVFESHC